MTIMEGDGSVTLDEEKRLCYVAMTRAKMHLVMAWQREVSVFNGNGFTATRASRSRFLDVLVAKNGKGDKKQGNPGQGKRHVTGNKTIASIGHGTNSNLSTSLPRAGKPRAPPQAGPDSARRHSTASTKPLQRVLRVTPNSRAGLQPKAGLPSLRTAPKKSWEVPK